MADICLKTVPPHLAQHALVQVVFRLVVRLHLPHLLQRQRPRVPLQVAVVGPGEAQGVVGRPHVHPAARHFERHRGVGDRRRQVGVLHLFVLPRLFADLLVAPSARFGPQRAQLALVLCHFGEIGIGLAGVGLGSGRRHCLVDFRVVLLRPGQFP